MSYTDRFLCRGMTVNGEWVCGYLSVITKEQKANVEPGFYISNRSGMPFAFKVRPETVGQCTGLKDCKGRLIFQGDIVKPTDPELRGLYEVKWNEKTYAFDFQKVNGYESQKFYYLYSDDVEITGNIHDNA